MDDFREAAENSGSLATSHLVGEMKYFSRDVEVFPVIVGEFVTYFHDVGGGYYEQDDSNIVNFIHRVQGPESPPNKVRSPNVEAHIGEKYFNLGVENIWHFGDYPDEDYTLSAKVTGYRSGPYSFSDKLKKEVDKRETEYSWEG